MSDRKPSSERDQTLPLLEEQATIDKRTVTTGKVSVVTHTETVEELIRAVLKGEESEVVTVELDQPVIGPAPRIRIEDGVTIIPVLEEVLVVEKRRLRVKSELKADDHGNSRNPREPPQAAGQSGA